MNVIFLQYLFDYLDGAVIDSLDYYCIIRKVYPNIPLVYITPSSCPINILHSQIKQIIYERYLESFDFKIKTFSKVPLSEKAITIGLHSYQLLSKLYPTKYLVIGQFDKEELEKLTKISVCPNHYISDGSYQMKIPFNDYKKYVECKHSLYINTLDNKYDKKYLTNLAKHLGYKYREIIIKKRRHQFNLFSKFDTYLYLDDGKYVDVHPRLFHECYFHEKNIVYVSNRKKWSFLQV